MEDTRFPLTDLPDTVLLDILRRCPPGSISGFDLPLALAQVRLLGTLDPHWAAPLLRLATSHAFVRDRLAAWLASLNLTWPWSEPLLSRALESLPRLRSLQAGSSFATDARLTHASLSLLPSTLTRLALDTVPLAASRVLSFVSTRLAALQSLSLMAVDAQDFHLRGQWDAPLAELRYLGCLRAPDRSLPGLSALVEVAPRLEALKLVLEHRLMQGIQALAPLGTTLTGLTLAAVSIRDPPLELGVLAETLPLLERLAISADEAPLRLGRCPGLANLTRLTALELSSVEGDDDLALLCREFTPCLPPGLALGLAVSDLTCSGLEPLAGLGGLLVSLNLKMSGQQLDALGMSAVSGLTRLSSLTVDKWQIHPWEAAEYGIENEDQKLGAWTLPSSLRHLSMEGKEAPPVRSFSSFSTRSA